MRRSPRFSREIREIGFFNMQTLKLLTTSKRYHRLEKDLDINAGRLLEGVSLEQLVQEVDDFLLAGKVQGGRLPAPDGFAASLNLSVAYFNDLLAFELGKPFSIYIQFRQLELAKRLALLADGLPEGSFLIGPAPASIGKISDVYRFVIYVKSPDYDVLIRVTPGRSDLVETRTIDGNRYILIRANEGVELNGLRIAGESD